MSIRLFVFILFFSQALQAFDGPAPEPFVNINQASVEEIAHALKGVGLKKAQAIVEYRELVGKIKYLEELTAVKGVGKATIAKNKTRILLK